ncbi:hypothetical protein QL285_075876 [Trifolium repens]|nr:hypothetical protein QL285_075876 [Trifolium repens]
MTAHIRMLALGSIEETVPMLYQSMFLTAGILCAENLERYSLWYGIHELTMLDNLFCLLRLAGLEQAIQGYERCPLKTFFIIQHSIFCFIKTKQKNLS